MGKKSRRARSDQPARVKRKPVPFVERPFDGLSAEADLVAMREILPAATITATTTADHGSRTVTFVTLLPQIWAALARDDGEILVALQTNERSGDASRDAAAALVAALDAEPGTEIASVGLLEPGTRLQDVLEPDSFGEIELSEGFDFWLAPDAERTDEVAAALEQSGEGVVPTEAVPGVPSAYWCRMNREFLRWVRPEDPDVVLDGLARLHAAREDAVVDGARFVGAFRAAGLIVPVWELPDGTGAEALAEPVAAFATTLEEAIARDGALDVDERRARAGLVSRQVSL